LLADAMPAAVEEILYPSVEEAVQVMVKIDERLDPIPENIAVYEQAYAHYCQINDVLGPLFNSISTQKTRIDERKNVSVSIIRLFGGMTCQPNLRSVYS
jgi:ribulose kinase